MRLPWLSVGVVATAFVGGAVGQCPLRSACDRLDSASIVVLGIPSYYPASQGLPAFGAFKVHLSIKGGLEEGDMRNFGFVNSENFIERLNVPVLYVLSMNQNGNYLTADRCGLNKPFYKLTTAEKAALKDYPASCAFVHPSCAEGVERVQCAEDPCVATMCPRVAGAACVPNFCGACTARFYYRGQDVTSECVRCSNGVTMTTCRQDPCVGRTCLRYPHAQCAANWCGDCSVAFHVNGTRVEC